MGKRKSSEVIAKLTRCSHANTASRLSCLKGSSRYAATRGALSTFMKWRTVLLLCLTFCAPAGAADKEPTLPRGYKLLYEQKFTGPENLRDFVMTDPKAWAIMKTNDVVALDLVTQSKYNPA